MFIFINIHQYFGFARPYLELHFLKIEHTDLWDFVDDVKPVVLLVCHRILQQAASREDRAACLEAMTKRGPTLSPFRAEHVCESFT